MLKSEREKRGKLLKKCKEAIGVKGTQLAKKAKVKFTEVQDLFIGDNIPARKGARILRELNLLPTDFRFDLVPQKMSFWDFWEVMEVAHRLHQMTSILAQVELVAGSVGGLLEVGAIRTDNVHQYLQPSWQKLEEEGITRSRLNKFTFDKHGITPVRFSECGVDFELTISMGGDTFYLHSHPPLTLREEAAKIMRLRYLIETNQYNE